MGRGIFLGVSHAPTARGRCPALPSFGGSFLFMRTLFDAEIPVGTKFGVVTHMGIGLVFRGKPWPRSKGRSPSAPQFLRFSSIYNYIA